MDSPESAPKIRVLVVDDSATIRAVLCRELPKDPAIEVIAFARDGLDGVEKALALKPDVITLDIEMPRLHGHHPMRRSSGCSSGSTSP